MLSLLNTGTQISTQAHDSKSVDRRRIHKDEDDNYWTS
jgi:hypothetical protein